MQASHPARSGPSREKDGTSEKLRTATTGSKHVSMTRMFCQKSCTARRSDNFYDVRGMPPTKKYLPSVTRHLADISVCQVSLWLSFFDSHAAMVMDPIMAWKFGTAKIAEARLSHSHYSAIGCNLSLPHLCEIHPSCCILL